VIFDCRSCEHLEVHAIKSMVNREKVVLEMEFCKYFSTRKLCIDMRKKYGACGPEADLFLLKEKIHG